MEPQLPESSTISTTPAFVQTDEESRDSGYSTADSEQECSRGGFESQEALFPVKSCDSDSGFDVHIGQFELDAGGKTAIADLGLLLVDESESKLDVTFVAPVSKKGFDQRRPLSDVTNRLNHAHSHEVESPKSRHSVLAGRRKITSDSLLKPHRKRSKAFHVFEDSDTNEELASDLLGPLLTSDDHLPLLEDERVCCRTSLNMSISSASTTSFRRGAGTPPPKRTTPILSSVMPRTMSSSVFEMGEASTRSPVPTPSVLEVNYSLTVVEKPQIESQAFKSISCDTLAELLVQLGESFTEKYVLVDCRYPYEYNGGHIRSAINIHEKTKISEIFYPESCEDTQRMFTKIPIFYCEFSQKRGPTMAHALRTTDRIRNVDLYPHVDYKEIYVLDYGYQRFFKHQEGTFQFLIAPSPAKYVPMNSEEHTDELRGFKAHHSKGRMRKTVSDEPTARRGKAMQLTVRKGLSVKIVETTETASDSTVARLDFDKMSADSPQATSPHSLSQPF